jgi:hypothetical protein
LAQIISLQATEWSQIIEFMILSLSSQLILMVAERLQVFRMFIISINWVNHSLQQWCHYYIDSSLMI